MIPGSVVVAWPTGGNPTWQFTRSLANLVGWSVGRLRGQIALVGGPRIASNRNSIVTQFLRSDAEWLFMVDDDMQFEHDIVERLIEAADPEKMPILGALCFGAKENRVYPTIYRLPEEGWVRDPNRLMLAHTELTGEPVEVDATGAAALLIHRRVLEALGVRYPKPYRWFAETTLGEWEVGEDITFCLRAKAAGFPIYVHTGISVGHVKEHIIDRAFYESLGSLPDNRAEVVQLPHPDWPNTEDDFPQEADHG